MSRELYENIDFDAPLPPLSDEYLSKCSKYTYRTANGKLLGSWVKIDDKWINNTKEIQEKEDLEKQIIKQKKSLEKLVQAIFSDNNSEE